MQAALRARLLGQTAAGQKVYWVTRPQATTLPSITLQTVSSDRPQTHSGMQGLRSSRVQLDYWGATYGDARAGIEAAIAVLTARRITSNGIFFDHIEFEGERDFIETVGSASIHRTSIDLIVWHHPA